MTWNYRMTRETVQEPDGTTAYLFAVREIYYNDDGSLSSWTVDPVAPIGDTWMELADTLAKYAADAMSYDVLDIDTREWIKRGRSADLHPTPGEADAS